MDQDETSNNMEVNFSEVNENNNIYINKLRHQLLGKDNNSIKQEPLENMSRSHLKSLSEYSSNRNEMPAVKQNDLPFKVENSEQLMMLQLYIQNKYIDDFLRKTQASSYFNQLSKLMRPESPSSQPQTSPSPVPPQEHPLDLSLKSERAHSASPSSSTSSMDFDATKYPPHEFLQLQYNNNNNSMSTMTPTDLSQMYNRTLSKLASRRMINPSNSNNNLMTMTESDTEISNVIQNIVKEEEQVFSCGICNQVFNIRDRLAKHIASCHKNKKKSSDITKTYECDVCKRSFARSDMLTRHSRLHTGIKPYACNICGQVFSRSDHLSTHQRTHSGEKPYKCPYSFCQYAACRRDMINRHMRTHMKHENAKALSPLTTFGDQNFSFNKDDLKKSSLVKTEV